jgi:MFS family permease
MSLMLFILQLPISSYIAALSFIKEEWSLNNLQAGAVYSAYLGGAVVSALFLVPLTDRLGTKRILLGSALVSVAAHLLFPLAANDVASAVVLRAIAGVGYLGVYTPGLRIVARRFPGGSRGMAMGLFVTAQYAAHSGSLALTGGLMSQLGWRDAYLVVSLLAILSLPMAYFLLRSQAEDTPGGSTGRLVPGVLRNPAVQYLILGYSLHSMQLFAVRLWLPLFLTGVLLGRGVDSAQAAVTAATVGGLTLAFGSIGPVMGGIISDRWGRAASATAIFALSGACSWLIGWTGDLPWALIIGIGAVYGWAIAADSAIYQAGVIEVSNPDHLGSTMAMQASLGLMGGVAGPIAFGAVLDLSPVAYEWGVAFSALGILAIVAVSGLQRLRTLPQDRLMAGGKG